MKLKKLIIASVFGSMSLTAMAGTSQFCSGDLIFDQPPNQVNGNFIDLSCSSCGTGVQVIAENFIIPSDALIEEFVIYAGYYDTNTPLATDLWTVNIHEDNGGEPGNIIYTEDLVSSSREVTGVVLFGVDEYRINLSLQTPQALTMGTYWVEIHNDTGANADDVFWEQGDLDQMNGVDGSRFATEYPVATWNTDPGNFALQICDSDLIFKNGFDFNPTP